VRPKSRCQKDRGSLILISDSFLWLLPTADFSVIDPYRMMRTDGSAEKPTRPIVHAWCVRVNINATRCSSESDLTC
jgi:hypothetical protein